MNKLFITGNLTKDPELRITQGGISVCSFTVAVNRRRHGNDQPEADFFRVTTWRELAESCGKYLCKGRKVAVTGEVSVSTYKAADGTTRANLDLTANDVEFLSPAQKTEAVENKPNAIKNTGYEEIMDDELPWK